MTFQPELPFQPISLEVFDDVDSLEVLAHVYRRELAGDTADYRSLLDGHVEQHNSRLGTVSTEELGGVLESTAADIAGTAQDASEVIRTFMRAAADKAVELRPDLPDIIREAEQTGESLGYDHHGVGSAVAAIGDPALRFAAGVYLNPRIMAQVKRHVQENGSLNSNRKADLLACVIGEEARQAVECATDIDVIDRLQVTAAEPPFGVSAPAVRDLLKEASGDEAGRAMRAVLDLSVYDQVIGSPNRQAFDIALEMASNDAAYLAMSNAASGPRRMAS